MKRLLHNNGLSLVMLGFLFPLFLLAQSITGFWQYNEEAQEHQKLPTTYTQYLKSPHFIEATTENWESEFLQMFLFVFLTVYLYQKGSSESKDPDANPKQETKSPHSNSHQPPWPVRRGGWVLKIYQNSLSLTFLVLFLCSMFLHAWGGAKKYEEEQREHGNYEEIETFEYIQKSQFWFESFQNWQSEFLAIGSMVVLSIWLRQKNSPESKRVNAPHSQTGKD